MVGNIDTTDRFADTVIGDTVNLASRLESLNKVYGTLILASPETREAAGDAFAWRRVDRTSVEGRAGGGFVYEFLGPAGKTDAQVLHARDLHEKALNLCLQRGFDEASSLFEAPARLRPDDAAASDLAARARARAQAPPNPAWDGVHVQTVK